MRRLRLVLGSFARFPKTSSKIKERCEAYRANICRQINHTAGKVIGKHTARTTFNADNWRLLTPSTKNIGKLIFVSWSITASVKTNLLANSLNLFRISFNALVMCLAASAAFLCIGQINGEWIEILGYLCWREFLGFFLSVSSSWSLPSSSSAED